MSSAFFHFANPEPEATPRRHRRYMYIKDTELCAPFRSGRLAIKRPALSALRRHIVVVLCSLWVSAPAWAADEPLDTVPFAVASRKVLDAAGVLQHGIASWYGERFQNKRTANGERFNMNALTAAHPTLPFGTRLCAHSPKTGKSVIVRINDRGPFVKHRIIDFSKAAAQALGIVHSRPDVVALLDSSDKRCEKG